MQAASIRLLASIFFLLATILLTWHPVNAACYLPEDIEGQGPTVPCFSTAAPSESENAAAPATAITPAVATALQCRGVDKSKIIGGTDTAQSLQLLAIPENPTAQTDGCLYLQSRMCSATITTGKSAACPNGVRPIRVAGVNAQLMSCVMRFIEAFEKASAGTSICLKDGYRAAGEQACAVANPVNQIVAAAGNSAHERGLAVDIGPRDSSQSGYDKLHAFAKAHPEFGIAFSIPGDNPHVIPTTKACGAGAPASAPPVGQGTPVAANSTEAMCARQYASNPAGYAACVHAYQRIDAQVNDPRYGAGYGTPIAGRCYRDPGGMLQELPCASSSSGGFLSSLFGGNNKTTACFRYTGSTYVPASCSISSGGLNSLFGGNSSLGQMMQGMQLGQGLGSSLFGGSGSSNPTPSAPAPSYYNPLMPPPIPVQTSDVTQPPPGSSAIDQLIATLGSTTANPNTANPPNTNISVATNSVGVVQQPSNGISNLSNMSSSSIAQMQQQIIDLNGQLNAATTSIAFASSTGNTPAIVGALNSIGVALSAIGQFFANIFTPGATTTP